ncbi:MAG: phosphotransferase [Clostridia bacterium]|nr:phosphotransferase [Clostridia bacterium]
MNALLQKALAAFGLTGAAAEFIQQHENAVYRVDGKYLLRIHKAAEGLYADHDPEKRRAELAFLTHLADRGLHVQRPIAETTLSDGSMATLLTFLPGHHITEAEFTPEMQHQIGAITARLHQGAQGFAHPAMRRYDTAHVARTAADISRMGERYSLNADEIATACQAAQVIEDRLRSAAAEFVPIHCDLSQSNILLTDTGLAPIDFSLFGLGHPMHDLGILLGNVSTLAQRKAIADGYVQAGGRIDLPLLDAGMTLGLLEALVFHADVWPKEAWFAPRLTRWANEMLRPLAEDKPLLDENMYLINLK